MREKNLTKRRVGLFIIALGILFMLYPLTPILYNSLMETRRIEEFRRAENEMDVSTRGSLLSQAPSSFWNYGGGCGSLRCEELFHCESAGLW